MVWVNKGPVDEIVRAKRGGTELDLRPDVDTHSTNEDTFSSKSKVFFSFCLSREGGEGKNFLGFVPAEIFAQ